MKKVKERFMYRIKDIQTGLYLKRGERVCTCKIGTYAFKSHGLMLGFFTRMRRYFRGWDVNPLWEIEVLRYEIVEKYPAGVYAKNAQ